MLILKDCPEEHSWNKQLFLLKRLHSHGWFLYDLIISTIPLADT